MTVCGLQDSVGVGTTLQTAVNLLLILLILLLLGLSRRLGGFLLSLGSLRISSLFAGPHSEPLWQFLGGPLLELVELLLPHGLQPLCPDHLGASLVQLLPVSVGPGVCPPLVLGEHVDGWGVLACEGLGVQTLLDGLVPQLQLLPLGQFLELVVLVKLPLLIVVFVCFQCDDGVPDLVSFVLKFVRVHGVHVQGLDADGQGDLHLLLHLLLGFGHLLASVHGRTRRFLAALLLSCKHLLSFPFIIFHLFLLCQSLGFPLLSLLLLHLLLLGPLSSSLFLLLLCPDLLPGGLFVLQPLQL